MSGQLDLERRIDAYFAEGPGRAPDHLLGQSLRAATAERQARRSWWPGGLDRGARRDVWLVLAGAAAALVLGGLVLLRGGLIPLPGPTDSALPGATPSAAATPTLRASAAPTSPLPTAASTLPSPTAVPSPDEPTRVQPGTGNVTFDVSGWRVMTPGEGRSEALALAVMAAENPLLDGIGGVPRGGWHGLWLTRPTAWVHIVEAPKIRGITATRESATRQAKAMAVNDPRRIGDASFKPNVTLVAGPRSSIRSTRATFGGRPPRPAEIGSIAKFRRRST